MTDRGQEWPRREAPCPPELGRAIAYEACVHELMNPTAEGRKPLDRMAAEARASELMSTWFKP